MHIDNVRFQVLSRLVSLRYTLTLDQSQFTFHPISVSLIRPNCPTVLILYIPYNTLVVNKTARRNWPLYSTIFGGCVDRRASNSVWRCWRSVVNMVPSYMPSELRRASDVVSGRHLRSSTAALVVPTFSNRRPRVSKCKRTRVKESFAGWYPVFVAVLC